MGVRRDMIMALENQKEIEKISTSLDSANITRLSYGSVQSKKNNANFSKWFRKQQRRLKKALGIKQPLFWDSLKGSRRL